MHLLRHSLLIAAGLVATAGALPDAGAQSPRAGSGEWVRLVDEDWLRQAEARATRPLPVTTPADAAGACDGARTGTYGFHTGHEADPGYLN